MLQTMWNRLTVTKLAFFCKASWYAHVKHEIDTYFEMQLNDSQTPYHNLNLINIATL